MSEEYSGTKRSGIQSLYTFTPFKLLFGKQGYGIILVPLEYYNKLNIEWNAGINDEFYVPYYKRDFKVTLPDIINSFIFAENSDLSVEYKHRSLAKPDYRIERDDAAKPFPLILEYSYKSLRNGYHCKYGMILLHEKKDCPLKSNCKLFEKSKDGKGCKYYEGPIPYERLYTIFPHVVRYVMEDNSKNKKILALIVVKIGNADRILGKIEFSEKLRMEAFSDATIFYDKAADLMYKDFLWVSYENGIGFRLNNLHGIIFKFNSSSLNDYISFLINNNQEIKDWLCMKMSIYFGDKNDIGLKKYSLSQKGFLAMKRFEDLIDKVVNGEAEESCNEDNLTLFGSLVLLHTLAHVIITNILEPMSSINASGNFTYYIAHPIFGELSSSVYIVESIYGGLGYLKTLSIMINKGDKELSNVLSNLPNVYNAHEGKLNKALNGLGNVINNFSKKLDKEIIQTTLNIFNEWQLNSPFPKTFPNHLVIRNYLGKRFSQKVNMDSDTRQAFKDMISELPLCWDGCNMCVGMDKGCIFGPYDQPFLISRKLINQFISTYDNWLGRTSFPFTNNLYHIFVDLVNLAENDIKLISPWIGKEIIDVLIKAKKEKDLLITIVCLDDEKNKNAIKVAENNGIHVIKIPATSEQGIVHSKMMIIDDSIALTGSANFTENGLKFNKETVTVSIDPYDVGKYLEQFNEITKNYKLYE
ncbi:phospholipase D-like domain-containing protein [Sulfurisphaera ohwakuensis]|nr:phospholipase D-like domain-containing protein [Sulfurisphaera ohwakuensis]MBB5254130.1 hypothetical protein [Sulfurisphaera ohwakuensis]